MASKSGGPDDENEDQSLQSPISNNTLRTAGGTFVASVGLAAAAALGWVLSRAARQSAGAQTGKQSGTAATGEFTDISRRIFNSDVATYKSLMAADLPKFRLAIKSLINQVDRDDLDDLRNVLSDDKYIITDSILSRLVALFNGYEYEENSRSHREFIPIMDVILEDGFSVGFVSDSRKSTSASFKIKVIGIGGTGACVFRRNIKTSFGPYVKSCQLQVPVVFSWAKWVRRASGEALFVLRVVPESVANPKLTTEDETQYKPIKVPREEQVTYINKVGSEETKVSYTIEKSFNSRFDCDISELWADSPGKFEINIESTTEASLEMEIRYDKEGRSGHLYASAPDAVLFRTGS